jgi:hypothetical protein
MILGADKIRAMCEGMRRVRRRPAKEWLEPIIRRLEALKPGERLIIEHFDYEKERAAQRAYFAAEAERRAARRRGQTER